jgi:hypothetical protein
MVRGLPSSSRYRTGRASTSNTVRGAQILPVPELCSGRRCAFLEEGGNLAAWLLKSRLGTRCFREDSARGNLGSPDLARSTVPTAQAQVFVASAERFLHSDIPAWQMSDGSSVSLPSCPSSSPPRTSTLRSTAWKSRTTSTATWRLVEVVRQQAGHGFTGLPDPGDNALAAPRGPDWSTI